MKKKEIYHVVAMSRNRVIGKDNKLPWHFPSDLKSFKELTMGHTLIMGRKTFESIGRVLPGRPNRVLSRAASKIKSENDPEYFESIEAVLQNIATEKAFIIGGAEIFRQTMDLIDGIYLTKIDQDYSGDAFYPELKESFKEDKRELIQENPRIERIFYRKKDIL